MCPCPERRGLVVGHLCLETGGKLWLLNDADRSLMKFDKLGRLTKKEPEKWKYRCFPTATLRQSLTTTDGAQLLQRYLQLGPALLLVR